MTNQASGDESRWLVAPLEPKEARIFVAVAEDAELSLAMRAALEQLAAAMQTDEAEVQGYLLGACAPYNSCTDFNCKEFGCQTHACSGFGSNIASSGSSFSPLGITPMSFGLFSR